MLHLIDVQAARLQGVDLPGDDSPFMTAWRSSPYTALPQEQLEEAVRRQAAAAARLAFDFGLPVAPLS